MTYEVRMTPPAQREFDKLPTEAQVAMAQGLRDLAVNPRPPGAIPLKGKLKGHYRIRVGGYRIAYSIDDEARRVWVWQMGNRRGFYEKALRRQKG